MKWLTIISCLFLVPLFGQSPIEIAPQSLGYQVNSEAVEQHPLISTDGQSLYFIRSAHPQNMGAENLDDIWMSYYNPNEGWSRAINVGGPLNNQNDNAVIGIDASGEILYLKNSYDGSQSEGIAISYLKKRHWSKPQSMPIENYFNLSINEDFTVGLNGGVLIMSIEQPEGLGDRDLYVSFRKNENSWQTPIHMGQAVNSIGEEAGVHLAPDGKTLFFSSNGQGGEGGLDLFVSKRLDNSWTNWSVPQNLGPSINSSEDEYSISVPGHDAFAYFSKRDTNGNFQIFQTTLPASLLPEPIMMVSGQFIDATSQTTQGGKLTFKHFYAPQTLTGYIQQDKGSYKIALPYGEDLSIYAEAKGYFAVSEYFELSNNGLEEEDLDPANMVTSLNLDAGYLQRDEMISNLQLKLQSLNGELKNLNDQRQAYKEKLIAERAKLSQKEAAYLRTDPELEALRHRYNNYLAQLNDTIPVQPTDELRSRGIPESYDQPVKKDAELEAMKARLDKHYQSKNEESAQNEGYLWDEAIGFDDLQKDVESELKKELVPIVTQELQEEMINEVRKDLERSMDKESLKKASTQVSNQPIFKPEPVKPDEFQQTSIIKADLRQTIQPYVKKQIKTELADEVRQVLQSELAYQARKEKENDLQRELDIQVFAQIRHEEQANRRTSNIPKELIRETRTAPAPVYKEVQQNLFLLPIKEGQIIPLNNIFFNPNTAILKPTSFAELDRVASFLEEHPAARVEFGGHTNGWSSHTFATRLSNDRAFTVVDYLIEQGIEPYRMKAKGYGKTMPVATNDTVEGRKQNQRIEMKILGLE